MMGKIAIYKYFIGNSFLIGTLTFLTDAISEAVSPVPFWIPLTFMCFVTFVIVSPELGLVFPSYRKLISEGIRTNGAFGQRELSFLANLWIAFTAFRMIMFTYVYKMLDQSFNADTEVLWAIVAIGGGLGVLKDLKRRK